MKKIEDTKFFCIDFANCDLSKDRPIDSLVKTFLHPANRPDLEMKMIKCGISYLDPLTWKSTLLKNRETLEEIQKSVADFVDRSIGRVQRSTKKGNTTIKDFIIKKAGRLRYRFRSVPDPTTSLVKGELFRDLMGLYRGDCWNRVIRCSKCNRFFIARTVRPQEFCSDKCRWNYHNREKQESGERNEYMRKYLPGYRKRKLETK